MLAMPGKRKTAKADGDKPPRKGRSVQFYLEDERLAEALEGYIADARPKPTIKSVIEAALEEFLQKRDCWPPKD